MKDLILARIKKNNSLMTDYVNAMAALNSSGILQFMKARAEPSFVGQGSDHHAMATQAARSAGYFEAIRDLEYFREIYIDPEKVIDVPRDYGGNQIALESGLLTEEEIDAIRTGKPINYKATDIRKSKPGA